MKIKKRAVAAAVAAATLGYVIGDLNPAYVLGLRKGYDIRKKGSGNAGATNLMILEGKKAGAFVMCFDISKAAASVGVARRLMRSNKYSGEIAGTACILGHMYPALMHFRGGKGLACLGGVILAFGVHDDRFDNILHLSAVSSGVHQNAAAHRAGNAACKLKPGKAVVARKFSADSFFQLHCSGSSKGS